MKKIIHFLKSKMFFIGFALCIQLLALIIFAAYLSTKFLSVYYFMLILSFIVSVYVINRESDSSSKILWVLIIMALPFFGGIMYLLFGARKIPKSLMIKDRQAYSDYKKYAQQNLQVLKSDKSDYILDKMASLAWSNGYFPVYKGMKTKYYSSGQDQYQDILYELEKAQEFIFLEFFIINHGLMWDTILQILLDKAALGVDVRLIYDDAGSLTYLEEDYPEWLEKRGIHTIKFNPMRPQLAMQMNNRDHRKILVIDGRVAFTGGCNISDEYINTKERFGYWKDMGMKMEGEGVETFTISFLQIWNYQALSPTRYDPFVLPSSAFSNRDASGYLIPFSDSPTDDNNTGKNMHLNMINLARNYFWVTTPYLILDSEMIYALTLAVNNGVDVRIIVPAIPDKKMVYQVTKANYDILIKHCVKIYEYTPGFIHGKVCLSDDHNAMVGTVNMDFRSYYLHYECGVWMRDTTCISDIKADFEQIFLDSKLVTWEDCKNVNPFLRFYRYFLKVFSPLL